MENVYSQRLLEASKKFTGTKFQKDIDKATISFLAEKYDEMDKILNRLPTEPELLETLLEKLKGKSVEKGIRKALKETSTPIEQGKALSSLLTHCLIECEHNNEYKALLPGIYERLGQIINRRSL
jgi:TnpA family transposase